MADLLESQRLALGAWQAACRLQPGLHAHQLRALDRELALSAAASDLEAYRRASGGGFELTRACWLDRIAARLRSAHALADPFTVQATLCEFRAALQAKGPSDWAAALGAAAQAAAPWHGRATAAASGPLRTLLNLLMHHTDLPPQAEHRANAIGAWQAWCEADPWAASAVVHDRPLPLRTRQRLPWASERPWRWRSWLQELPEALPVGDPGAEPTFDASVELAALGHAWQQQSSNRSGTADDCGPAWDAATARAEQALAPWRRMAQAASGEGPVAQAMAAVAQQALALAAGCDDGPAVLRCLIEHRLPARLSAAAVRVRIETLEQRQAVWPQPLLVAHAAALGSALSGAVTDTEVEAIAQHAEACLAVEADWQALLFGVALAPLRAAMNVAINGPVARPALDLAVMAGHEWLGLGPRALLASPLLSTLVNVNLERAVADPAAHQDSLMAEAGAEMLPLLLAWTGVAAAQGLPRSLSRLLDHVAAAEPAAAARPLQLWQRQQPASEAWRLLAAPERPRLPLWQAAAAASL